MGSEEQVEDKMLSAYTWVRQKLAADCTFSVMQGDASVREYYRVHCGEHTYVLMDTHLELDNVDLCQSMTKLYGELDVRVPKIIQMNASAGWLLIEDFGSEHLLDRLRAKPEQASLWYARAWQSLLRLQGCDRTMVAELPEFSADWIARELTEFVDWFVPAIKNKLTDEKISAITGSLEQVLLRVVALPKCFVHRDFHAGNLMVLPSDEVGVLDFQSSFWGPITYDLVSLLRDCYIDWPQEQVREWVERYYEEWKQGERACSMSVEDFWSAFEWVGLQRHLRCLGLFVRLAKQGQTRYLSAMPRVLSYAQYVCQRHSSLASLVEVLAAGQQEYQL